jgi:tight adherence protein B
LAVAAAAWGVTQFILALADSDRYRLQQRLGGQAPGAGARLAGHAILLDQRIAGLPPSLARRPFIQNLNRQLLYAFPDASLAQFLMIRGASALGCFVLVTLVMDSLVLGFAAGAAASYVPMLVLHSRRSRRQRSLADQLPDALDFLSRVLRAGHSLSTGIQMMGQELPHPIAGEFRRCHDEHSLGHPLEEALREMAGRVDSTDFAFFVTAVLIQRQTGGDLSEVLSNISGMVRSRIRLQQHVKAITAEGRLTGYILMVFPAVLFAVSYVLNPGYAGTLLWTATGQMLLAIAVLLQAVGFVAIRRIVNVKV